MASTMFWFTLAMSLGEVGYRGIFPGGGVRLGSLLQHSSKGQPCAQARLAALHRHAQAQMYFTPGWCMQHWRIARGLGLVLEGPVFLGISQIWRSITDFFKDSIFYSNYRRIYICPHSINWGWIKKYNIYQKIQIYCSFPLNFDIFQQISSFQSPQKTLLLINHSVWNSMISQTRSTK